MSLSFHLRSHASHSLIFVFNLLLLQSRVHGAGRKELSNGLTLMSYVETPCTSQAKPLTWADITAQEKWTVDKWDPAPMEPPLLNTFWGDRDLLFNGVSISHHPPVGSDSSYSFGLNMAEGLVVIYRAEHYEASKFNMSQMISAYWQKQFDSGGLAAGQPFKKINTVVLKGTSSWITVHPLEQALTNTGGLLAANGTRKFQPYPAATSLAIRNGFYTLIGTPLGRWQTWMLIQRRDLWGDRTIESVEVMNLPTRGNAVKRPQALYYTKFVYADFDAGNPPDRSIPQAAQLQVQDNPQSALPAPEDEQEGGQVQEQPKLSRSCRCDVM